MEPWQAVCEALTIAEGADKVLILTTWQLTSYYDDLYWRQNRDDDR